MSRQLLEALGGVLGALGGVFGVLGGRLEGVLAASWRLLDASWRLLEASWRLLEASRRPCWAKVALKSENFEKHTEKYCSFGLSRGVLEAILAVL